MKKWYVSAKKADFNQIGKDFSIDPVVARIIRNRDIETYEGIEEYLHTGFNKLHDPKLMGGVNEGVELLSQRIESGSKIRIIGDYDIDGICATFILLKTIELVGGNVDYDIPDRITDGYGINENLIKKAYDDGVDTIITCDNGIAAFNQIQYGKELGLTIVVTDHHEIPFEVDDNGVKKEIIPPADVVINPHLSKCNYPFSDICGAVVAYKFAWALLELHNKPISIMEELIDIASIATIGDVMDLRGENRNIVKLGLQRIKETTNLGIEALIEVNGLDKRNILAYHIGFVIGPCLNAGGRLDTAKNAVKLLLSDSKEEAERQAKELFELNKTRKDMTLVNVEKAINQITENHLENDKVLVVYLPDCHESLIGIVAGRVREAYYRPVIVLSDGDEFVKGSGRSIEEYNMFEELSKVKDLFVKFGGHAMAAGLSLEKENIEVLREALNKNTTLTDEDIIEKIHIDVPMPISYVSEGLIQQFELLEPFGKGNPKPVFAEKCVNVLEARIIGKNANVLKLKLSDEVSGIMDGISFSSPEDFKNFIESNYGENETKLLFSSRSNKVKINIAYYPAINEFNGRRTIQINIIDYC